MNNLENCIKHLNNGLEFKKDGYFDFALAEYYHALESMPTYKHTYNNIAKILLTDMDNAYEMLLYYLTYAHLTFLQDELNVDNVKFAFENGFYNYEGFYNYGKLMGPINTYYRVIGERALGKIYADVNLTFNTGFTYLSLRPDICEFNKIPNSLINNQRSLLLGVGIEGDALVDSKYAPMIRNLGFIFLVDNMINNGNNSEEFASTVYFRIGYKIDDLYNDYN